MVSQSLTPVVASVWAWAPGRVSSDIHLTGPGGEWDLCYWLFLLDQEVWGCKLGAALGHLSCHAVSLCWELRQHTKEVGRRRVLTGKAGPPWDQYQPPNHPPPTYTHRSISRKGLESQISVSWSSLKRYLERGTPHNTSWNFLGSFLTYLSPKKNSSAKWLSLFLLTVLSPIIKALRFCLFPFFHGTASWS